MPTPQNIALFALASFLLALTPGPNLLYLVSRTLCQGRRAGIVSLAGTSLGFVFHVFAAALGLSAIFLTVPVLYDAVRYAGAGYLLWLAWGAVRRGGRDVFAPRALPRDAPGKLFRMGLADQRVESESGDVLSGAVSAVHRCHARQRLRAGTGPRPAADRDRLASDLVFVLAAGAITGWLARRPLWSAVQRWVLGVVLAGIAVRLAFDSRK